MAGSAGFARIGAFPANTVRLPAIASIGVTQVVAVAGQAGRPDCSFRRLNIIAVIEFGDRRNAVMSVRDG